MSLAENCRILREKMGLSQQELGDKTGMGQTGIWAIENGKSLMPRKLNQLAAVLKVAPNELMFGTPSHESNKLIYYPAIVETDFGDARDALSLKQAKQYLQKLQEDNLQHAEALPIAPLKLRLTTDSMESPTGDTFEKGSIVTLDLNQAPQNGDYVIATVDESDEEVVFRKLVIEGGMRELQALNERYKSIALTGKEHIHGVVTGKEVEYKKRLSI